MTIENTGVALARQAVEALLVLREYGPHLAPEGTDRFLWSADVLDELARAAGLLGAAVDQAAGEVSPGVNSRANDLSTAIVAHRNTLLRHGRGADPVAVPRPRAAARPGPTGATVDTISGSRLRST